MKLWVSVDPVPLWPYVVLRMWCGDVVIMTVDS